MKVLICDDDDGTRLLVSELLSRAFLCECVQCPDGMEALEVIGRQEIDVAVIDLHMPRMDGVALVQHIRSSPRLRELPVVMLTADAHEEAVRTLLSLGVSDYIVKPLVPSVALPKFERVFAGVRHTRYGLSRVPHVRAAHPYGEACEPCVSGD